MHSLRCCFLFLLVGFQVFAQEPQSKKVNDSIQENLSNQGVVFEEVSRESVINPLSPSKAAFYSAVIPGLGQIYNKRYWKAPIVWAAIGTGVYVYINNDNNYDRFRTAFKRRQAGFIDDEFYDFNGDGIVPGNPDFDDGVLQSQQERYQRDRDLALLITIGLYALNIIDANVDAHLKQFNVDEDLSMNIQPFLDYNEVAADPYYGLAFTFKF